MIVNSIKVATDVLFSEPDEQEWPENPTDMDCFGWKVTENEKQAFCP